MEKIAAVILAAGKGTRMNEGQASPIPKVMFEMSGKPIIDFTVENVKKSGVEKIVLVVGYKSELIRKHLNTSVLYSLQEEQLGTGHAVLMAKESLSGQSEAVLVCYGDMPLVKPSTIEKLIETYQNEEPVIVLLSAVSEDPSGYGRIIRDENSAVFGIKEEKDCTEEEKKIKEWNIGFYIFNAEWLWSNIDKINNQNAQKEYYLTDLVEMAREQEKKIIAIPVSEESEALGINTQEQLKEAEEILKSRG